MELLGHMVIPCLTYLATASQLWPTHNTFMVDMGENANFSTFLPRLVTLCSITTILVGKKWYLIVVFICISPLANDARLFFHVLTCHFCLFFAKMSIWIICLFFKGVIYLHFHHCVPRIPYTFWTITRNMICKCFLPFWELSSHSLDGNIWSRNIFNSNEVQFTYFSLTGCLCLWYQQLTVQEWTCLAPMCYL